MSTIYNISPGFLQSYTTIQSKKGNINMEEIFKSLSLEMGGDGSKITKDQLNKYIDKAESGNIKVDKKKLNALKEIQKNWDAISKGEDNITYGDFKDFPTLLAATLAGEFTATEVQDSTASMTDAIFDYLADELGVSDKSQITQSDLTSYLNDLITNASDENDSNGELIDAVTNLIATYSTDSTVETEA